jgi:hypothetical protein
MANGRRPIRRPTRDRPIAATTALPKHIALRGSIRARIAEGHFGYAPNDVLTNILYYP